MRAGLRLHPITRRFAESGLPGLDVGRLGTGASLMWSVAVVGTLLLVAMCGAASAQTKLFKEAGIRAETQLRGKLVDFFRNSSGECSKGVRALVRMPTRPLQCALAQEKHFA